MTTTVAIDIVSDTICPWCFVGKRRLERTLAMRPQYTAEVRWRPFQLDPTIPKGGIDRKAYLERKFGTGDATSGIHARVEAAGRGEGIDFAFPRILVTPNTMDSHRLIRWAGDAGVQDAVVERLFALYFLEGENIGDAEVLARAAAACGMDADEVRMRLAGDDGIESVESEIQLARRLGVEGVPFLIFADRFAVSGAQAPEMLVQALDRAAVEETSATES